MTQNNHSSKKEEVKNSQESSDNNVIIYGEYDSHKFSSFKKKKIRISLMDICIFLGIIAILGFIGFQSFESYGVQSRDEMRTGHLAIIREGLDKLRKEGKSLPEPYKKKVIIANNITIGIQGMAGEALFSAIDRKVLKDPLDGSYYIYYLQPETNQYEVMAYLEGTQGKVEKNKKGGIFSAIGNWFSSSTDYSSRTPYSIGVSGNILLANIGENKNAPLNIITNTERLDLTSLSKEAEVFFLGNNCHDILSRFPDMNGKDGKQLILLGEKITKVYCDMSTDGGGWTLFYANNGHFDSPTNASYVGMREKMQRGFYTLDNYDDTNLAGLLDTTVFTKNGSKEVLATNRIGGTDKWVKFSFDTSENLNWALGKDVLGNTGSGCYTLPNNGSWSIVNNDKKISYEGLKELMNHRGTSWGVGHDNFPCNNLAKSTSPHIAFYSANNDKPEARTRGTEGIGTVNRQDNEYRYFIR